MQNIKSHSISLIVPMAGTGHRFKSAGFEIYKPFLELAGKTMIDGVIEPFQDVEEIFILTTEVILNTNKDYFSVLPNNIRVVIISEHKLGPAYSLHLARSRLPENRSYIVAYCDVWWEPLDFNIRNLDKYEAAIFVHRGFHPHLVADNFSAFCSERLENDGNLLEIREKGSFTQDWMSEPVSIGVFYVRDCNILFDAIEEMVSGGEKAAGEYYPSVAFNHLVNSDVNVKLIDVKSYVHIGVPAQYKDMCHWSKIITDQSRKPTEAPTKESQLNCMLVGGSGTRMKNISVKPKHLIPVEEAPMFLYVANKFNCDENKIIAAPSFEYPHALEDGFEVIKLPEATNSHLETLAKALDYLPDNESILFSSCDCYGLINWMDFEIIKNQSEANCVVFSFEPTLLNKKNKQQHTTIDVFNKSVIDVDIKSKRKRYEKGLAGFFWFKNIGVIKTLLRSNDLSKEKGELLVDHLIMLMAKSKHKPICYELESYVHLGTPDEYNEFHYWSGRGSNMIDAGSGQKNNDKI
jgi:NDP-sugar pyrophosphorylase family protein